MGISYNTTVVRDGLVLHLDAANPKSYNGSGTVWADLSGKSNDATMYNGVAFDSTNNGGFTFDGVDDYVASSFVGTGSTFTTEVFIKPTNISKDQMYIGYSSIPAHYMRITQSKAFLSVLAAGAQRTLSHPTTLQNNNFYHIVSIYNGVQLKIYVNNVVAVGPVIDATLNGWGISRIGRWLDSDQRSFVGNTYCLRCYNRELSADEIRQNFEALRGRYGI